MVSHGKVSVLLSVAFVSSFLIAVPFIMEMDVQYDWQMQIPSPAPQDSSSARFGAIGSGVQLDALANCQGHGR